MQISQSNELWQEFCQWLAGIRATQVYYLFNPNRPQRAPIGLSAELMDPIYWFKESFSRVHRECALVGQEHTTAFGWTMA